MTARPSSPTVRLRRLTAELNRLHEARGLITTAAAKQAGVSPAKLSKALTGAWRLPDPEAVGRLADVYGVTDPQQREELVTLAGEARQRAWWHIRELSPGLSTFIGLEAEAGVQRAFEPNVIPGLLQTRSYARALIAGRVPARTERTVATLVDVRMQRQQRLTGADPMHLTVIVGESALRWLVGGPAVMVEQLEHLIKMCERPNVTVRILPFAVGAYPGPGPFILLTFADPLDPEVVYAEAAQREIWVEDRTAVAAHGTIFEHLFGLALPPDASTAMITKIIGELSPPRRRRS